MTEKSGSGPLSDRAIARIRSGAELLIETAGRRAVTPADACTVLLATAAGWLGRLVGTAVAAEILRAVADDLEALETRRRPAKSPGARPAAGEAPAQERLQ